MTRRSTTEPNSINTLHDCDIARAHNDSSDSPETLLSEKSDQQKHLIIPKFAGI